MNAQLSRSQPQPQAAGRSSSPSPAASLAVTRNRCLTPGQSRDLLALLITLSDLVSSSSPPPLLLPPSLLACLAVPFPRPCLRLLSLNQRRLPRRGLASG